MLQYMYVLLKIDCNVSLLPLNKMNEIHWVKLYIYYARRQTAICFEIFETNKNTILLCKLVSLISQLRCKIVNVKIFIRKLISWFVGITYNIYYAHAQQSITQRANLPFSQFDYFAINLCVICTMYVHIHTMCTWQRLTV